MQDSIGGTFSGEFQKTFQLLVGHSQSTRAGSQESAYQQGIDRA
jgi:hypothetical protein